MTKVTHKENHFVPKTFLKSWATKDAKEFLIYTLNLKNNFPRKQTTSSIAKKKNLYTLPLEFKTNDPKVVEHIIFKIWEDRWPSVLEGLKENKLSKDQTRDLKGFVIIQSFRTPKFEKENMAIIRSIADKETADLAFKYHYAFLGIKGFTDYIKDCTCQVLFINDIDNFICSDNPSTHWSINNNNFTYINGIAGRLDLFRNPNYKIICPVTPKHLVVLSPNLGIETNENLKEFCIFNKIAKDNIQLFNKMIEHGADKLLFAKNIYDFK
jgi:hypothetical protein